MIPSRTNVCLEASERLNTLKLRTGLTPNILCRFGLCLSLREAAIPDPSVYDNKGLEFNRSTLTGDYNALFEALLRERYAGDGIDVEGKETPEYFRAHLNRGVLLLYQNCRDVFDLPRLVPKSAA